MLLLPLQLGGGSATLLTIGFAILFFFIIIISFTRRYKRCPSDRILVVYGKVGSGNSARCIHGGAAFIWPVIQDYEFLDLTPISIEVNLVNALSKQNIRVNVPSRFTIGISTTNISQSVESELKKVGLKLINVNITDIVDESGYIEALGKEAAAHAINAARKSVAEKNRDGSIGEANALQDERTQVAAANAQAVEGENIAKINVANSDSLRRQREAEAERTAIASEKVQTAKALEESYAAEQLAELARAERVRSSQMADIVVPAEIDKKKVEIDAEADAERTRRIAKGEADAILFKAQAEAQGILEVLTKQAKGLDEIVKAAGNNPKEAVLLLIADKLPELVRLQAEAIKNIKIDKVTVWDSGAKSADGKGSTANFISGMYKSVPPLQEMFNMAGMQLPEYLKGKELEAEEGNDENKQTPKGKKKDTEE